MSPALHTFSSAKLRLDSRPAEEVERLRACAVAADESGMTFDLNSPCYRELVGKSAGWNPSMPARGLGDLVAKATSAVGIKPCAECKRRQEKLNRLFRFRRADAEPPPPLESRLAVGITAFLRPRCLERLHASIRARYPKVPIVIADNGDRPASISDPLTTYHTLPFDCGLSAARNHLIDHTETPYLLVLEEDFIFTPETKLEAFADVLDSDPAVGIVGGPLRNPATGVTDDYACDFDVFREVLNIVPARGPWRATMAGTSYRHCHQTFNFLMARRECLADHRWPDGLPLGEHFRYFVDVMKAGKWRVAFTRGCRADHDSASEREGTYGEKRRRASGYFREALRPHGLKSHTSHPALRFGRGQPPQTPDLVILGVGHSGTSVTARMLHALGWRAGDADAEYAESVAVRRLNDQAAAAGHLDALAAVKALESMPRPWCIKDPRFVETLPQWLCVLAPYEPMLVLLEREADAVRASHERRGELSPEGTVRAGRTVEEAQARAREMYDAWPWAKKAVRYEDVAAAAGMFSPPVPAQ